MLTNSARCLKMLAWQWDRQNVLLVTLQWLASHYSHIYSIDTVSAIVFF